MIPETRDLRSPWYTGLLWVRKGPGPTLLVPSLTSTVLFHPLPKSGPQGNEVGSVSVCLVFVTSQEITSKTGETLSTGATGAEDSCEGTAHRTRPTHTPSPASPTSLPLTLPWNHSNVNTPLCALPHRLGS